MKIYFKIKNELLPSLWMILLIVLPLIVYIVFSFIDYDILGGELSRKTSVILIGLFLYIAIFLYFIYRRITNIDRYEIILENLKNLDIAEIQIYPVKISKNERENLQYAQYVMDLAKNELLSLSVLSSPRAKNGKITRKEDIAARDVFRKMEKGDKTLAIDFKFKRIISLQDNDEKLFSKYLKVQKNANRNFKKGHFDFRIYKLCPNKNNVLIRFPNFIVADKKYVFITFRQYSAQSKGLFIISEEIGKILSSYFTYLWEEHCYK